MQPNHSDSPFLLRSPDDIRTALFELVHSDTRIVARNSAGQETAIEILAMDASVRRIYWRPRDHAGTMLASQGLKSLLAGSVFHFHVQGYGGGVVRFTVPRPIIVYSDEGEPALASPFPDEILHIQRRRSFRALADGMPAALARWTPKGAGQAIVMAIRDVSVDGLGLRVDLPPEGLPAVGATLREVSLHFGDYGDLTADLVVRNTYPIDGRGDARHDAAQPAPGPATLSHVGVSFMVIEPRHQSWLQQMVWRMERAKAAP